MARAGVLPGDTQASHTAFISAKFAMSVIQILAESNLLLSVPALARKPSICDEDAFGLLGHALALRRVGDDAGKIDRIAVDDGLAHARPGFVTFDCHGRFLSRLVVSHIHIRRQRMRQRPCASGLAKPRRRAPRF